MPGESRARERTPTPRGSLTLFDIPVGGGERVPLRVHWTLLLAQVNLAIGLFNLLPAFPLDGGRILRGALSRPLGPVRATRVASMTGRVVAVALGVVGVLAGAVLLTLIAVFVFVGATTESRA